MPSKSAVVALAAAALCACGPTELSEFERLTGIDEASREDAIVGGSATSGDANVFMLYMQANTGTGGSCTATLIDRRTLLTAAHCVDPRIENASSYTIFAMNKPSEAQAFQSDWIRIVETRMHPNWNPQTLQDDIAMALLERAPNVTPKQWNKVSIDNKSGAAVRAVGYGITTPGGSDSGTKRTVDLTITQISPTLIREGNGVNKGICQGDSGGPTFMTFPDGVERSVGVHSFTTSQNCTDGADTRVDAYQSFVQQWLNDREAPTCAEDGRCALNCPSVDYDCVCPADGQCTAACPDLSKDPDCPKDCVQNGVCSLQACPVADKDCLPMGQPCLSMNQCPGRLCISDALHPAPYCSKTCTADTDCDNGLKCDPASRMCVWPQIPPSKEGDTCTAGKTYCAPPTICEGLDAAKTSCWKACVTPADCTGNTTCATGFDGQKFCKPPDAIILRRAYANNEAAPGCTAVPGESLLALVALARLGLRRRSR